MTDKVLTDKERLVLLINRNIEVDAWDNGEFIETEINTEELAEILIANGVVVQKQDGPKARDEE